MNPIENPPTRAPYGGGSITALPNGHFRVRVRLAGGRRVSQTCATEADAKRLRAAIFAEIVETQPDAVPEPQCETLAAWGEKWLDRRELGGLHRNIATDRVHWRNHVLGTAIAETPLRAITRKMVRDWLSDLRTKRARRIVAGGSKRAQRSSSTRTPLAHQTVSNIFNLLRRALADAVDEELISENPARDVTVPKRAEASEKWTFLRGDEVERVCSSNAIPEPERLLFTVLIFQGLRAGEAWALRWGDVSLDGDDPLQWKLWVRRSHDGPTKSGKPRCIPLLGRAREALVRLRQLARRRGEDALVFPSPSGLQRHPGDDAGWSSRRRRGKPFVGYRERAGITRRVRLHDLRHTCASHLVMGTWGRAWSLDEVREFLRHSTSRMTERYAHLSPEHLHGRAAETAVAAPTVAQSEGSNWATPAKAESETRISRVKNQGGRDRDRTCDPRCVKPIESRRAADTYEPRGPIVAQSAALALLHGVEAGEAVGPHIDALVAAVLDAPLVQLALEAREPGPFRVRRALELAEAMLASIDARSARAG